MPSSHHTPHSSPSATAIHQDALQVIRGRRGRQARPSQLSPAMHRAVRKFSRAVGAPNEVPPAGFRDFRGWLARLSSRDSRPVWDQLIAAIAKDVSCDIDAVHALKEDVVREIVKCVVIPRQEESAKLVSTNAGRQASRPRSGTTLMVVLEQQLARVECRLPQLIAETSPSISTTSSDEKTDDVSVSSSDVKRSNQMFNQSTHSPGWSHRQRSSLTYSHKHNTGKLPSVSDILADRRTAPRTSLPSFKELDASLRKSRSSPSGGR